MLVIAQVEVHPCHIGLVGQLQSCSGIGDEAVVYCAQQQVNDPLEFNGPDAVNMVAPWCFVDFVDTSGGKPGESERVAPGIVMLYR